MPPSASPFTRSRVEIVETRSSGRQVQKIIGRTQTGLCHEFRAVDENRTKHEVWTFRVFAPDEPSEYISVEPISRPQIKSYADPKLEWCSLEFGVAHVGRSSGKRYAKLHLASLDPAQNDTAASARHLKTLPSFLLELRPIRKGQVASTAGTDGSTLVTIVKANEYAAMIKVLLAL